MQMATPAPAAEEPEYLTREQVVNLLQITPRTLSTMIGAGRFPGPSVLGKRLHRWPREQVMAFLESRKQGGGQ